MSQLHALQSGKSQPTAILFLHGDGLNAHQWDAQLAALGDQFHCIAPDLPEHGESAAIGPLTLKRAANEIMHLLEPVGKPVHLVGHSFGATLALQLIGHFPGRFTSALVTGGVAGLSPLLASVACLSLGLTGWISTERLIQMSYEQFRIPENQRRHFNADMRRSVAPEFMGRLITEMQLLNLPENATLPVLALVGSGETFPAKQAARTIARAMPNARAYEVPDVHHVWNLERPALFSAVVRDWVNNAQVRPPLRLLIQGAST